MNDDVMDQCMSLGEIVYLDTPTDQLTERIMARPTGCGEIVSFDPNDPKSFYIGVGNMRQWFFEDILCSRTNSNGTYRQEL